jgi:hypothetical protein
VDSTPNPDNDAIRSAIGDAEEVKSKPEAGTAQWPEPRPLPIGLPAVPAFDALLLPESLRPWVVDIADRAQAPLDFPAAGAIVGLSSVLGRRLGIKPKRQDDWLVVPNLWGLIVGPPGFLKSPMLREVLKPLMRLETEAGDEYKAARVEFEFQEAAMAAQRKKILAQGTYRDEMVVALRDLQADAPVQRRYVVNDPTVEKLGEILNANPAGVLLFRDEIAGFLATMERTGHENDRAFYLESWNGSGSYTYDRIGRGTLHIEAASVSLLGGITPGPVRAYLRETFAGAKDDGLIQRFQLAVYPDAPTTWSNIDRSPDTKAKARAFEIFKQLTGLGSGSVSFVSDPQGDEIPSLHFDADAQDFFDVWREKLEARIREPDEHPVMLGHLAKYRSLLPSLALLFHVSDCAIAADPGPVELESVRRAAAWCDYLEDHARRIYHCVTARTDTAVRLLGEKLRARKLMSPFTVRDAYRPQWTGLTEPEDAARALEVLEDLGWVVSEQRPRITMGGRPAIAYCINPRIWEKR